MDSIQDLLQSHIHEMSPSLAKVATWLSTHALQVAWNGIEDVAKQIEVSPATVVRALKQCGFDGYSDLQRRIRGQLPDSPLVWKMFQENPKEAVLNPIGAVVADEKANLDQLEYFLTPVIDELMDILLGSSRVVVIASLMTTPLAEYLALQLRLLIGHTDFVDASSSQGWLYLRDLSPDDCVLGLSYPRYSEATRKFLRQSSERTNRVVLMTDMEGPIVSGGSLTLRLPSKSNYHFSSNVSLMALIQILARGLSHRDPQRIMNNLKAADDIWTELDAVPKGSRRDIP